MTDRAPSSLTRARRTVGRLRARRGAGVHARLARLEQDLQESRQLNRRVAELTDLVTELVVPIARRDDAAVDDLLARYRALI